MPQRWVNRPEGSTWGDWGADDQLGRLNLLTPERRKRAAEEVREGLCFCLSLPLDLPGGNAINPKRHPPKLGAVYQPGQDTPYYNYDWEAVTPGNMDVSSDECVTLWSQYSTQWDSFAHVGSKFDADGDGDAEAVYYNGFRAGEHVKGPDERGSGMGARRLGVENMAANGCQGRGVLVDMVPHLGTARTVVGYDLLMQILEKEKAEVEEGDFFLFHVGWDDLILEMGGNPDAEKLHASGAVLDGFDDKLLQWITDSGVVALISDNMGIEDSHGYGETQGGCSRLPIHRHCLFRLGCHLGELWHLSELATALRARGRSRFLLTAPPLRMPGAVGSPATPVATI